MTRLEEQDPEDGSKVALVKGRALPAIVGLKLIDESLVHLGEGTEGPKDANDKVAVPLKIVHEAVEGAGDSTRNLVA